MRIMRWDSRSSLNALLSSGITSICFEGLGDIDSEKWVTSAMYPKVSLFANILQDRVWWVTTSEILKPDVVAP